VLWTEKEKEEGEVDEIDEGTKKKDKLEEGEVEDAREDGTEVKNLPMEGGKGR
jgi:hypothetical protein